MEIDRAKTEDIRNMAMKQVGETKKRKIDEGDDQKKRKRTRKSGGDTMDYLREKSKIERLEGKGARD